MSGKTVDNKNDTVEDIKNILQKMIESAEFYTGLLVDIDRHTPTCWRLHAACALQRALDLLKEDEDEDVS